MRKTPLLALPSQSFGDGLAQQLIFEAHAAGLTGYRAPIGATHGFRGNLHAMGSVAQSWYTPPPPAQFTSYRDSQAALTGTSLQALFSDPLTILKKADLKIDKRYLQDLKSDLEYHVRKMHALPYATNAAQANKNIKQVTNTVKFLVDNLRDFFSYYDEIVDSKQRDLIEAYAGFFAQHLGPLLNLLLNSLINTIRLSLRLKPRLKANLSPDVVQLYNLFADHTHSYRRTQNELWQAAVTLRDTSLYDLICLMAQDPKATDLKGLNYRAFAATHNSGLVRLRQMEVEILELSVQLEDLLLDNSNQSSDKPVYLANQIGIWLAGLFDFHTTLQTQNAIPGHDSLWAWLWQSRFFHTLQRGLHLLACITPTQIEGRYKDNYKIFINQIEDSLVTFCKDPLSADMGLDNFLYELYLLNTLVSQTSLGNYNAANREMTGGFLKAANRDQLINKFYCATLRLKSRLIYTSDSAQTQASWLQTVHLANQYLDQAAKIARTFTDLKRANPHEISLIHSLFMTELFELLPTLFDKLLSLPISTWSTSYDRSLVLHHSITNHAQEIARLLYSLGDPQLYTAITPRIDALGIKMGVSKILWQWTNPDQTGPTLN